MKYILLATLILLLGSCNEKDTVDRTEYYVIFKMPNGEQSNLGIVKGLSSCKYIASNYYFLRRSWIKKGWDYKCCLKSDFKVCEKYQSK